MANVRAPAMFTARPAATPRAVAARASRVADPVSLPVVDASGTESGTAAISLRVAGPESARHVVHRYLVMVRQNARQGSANTKTRSDVRGGGKKPMAQKGTGNARMGSKRSPLLPGGGVSFGPKPKDWSISMNKKERKLAMATALQSAASDMVVLEDIAAGCSEGKTKALVTACKNVGVDVMDTYTLLVTTEANDLVKQAGRNVAKLTMNTADCLSVYDVLRADKIIIEKAALEFVNEKYQ